MFTTSPKIATTSIGPAFTSSVVTHETEHGFDQHVDRAREEQHRVDERRKDLEPEQPEGPHPVTTSAVGDDDRGERERDADRVGRHVGGVGEQRQRVGDERGDDLDDHEHRRQHEGEPEPAHALGGRPAHGVGVVVRARVGVGTGSHTGILALVATAVDPRAIMRIMLNSPMARPEAQSDVVLSAEGVSFSYGSEPVLSDVSIAVRTGEFAALAGPNGSGKSTLLRIVLGLLTPRRGTVELFGTAPRSPA